jgi:hypothetical protein
MTTADRLKFVPHRSTIDGVPVYWTDTADSASPLTVALSFRVGMADETVTKSGG